MNIFYAIGGGLGHLNRVRVFIDQFLITPYKIITTQSLAEKFFAQDDLILVPTDAGDDQQKLAVYLGSAICKLEVSAFYIDTFPAGVLGELIHFKDMAYPRFYMARRLRWLNYSHFVDGLPFNFDKTYVLEGLETSHHQFIEKSSSETVNLKLEYPAPRPERIPANLIPRHKPLWIIVHSSSKEEVEVLYRHAMDIAAIENLNPFFVVLSDQKIDVQRGFCIPYFPANDWFTCADRIFSAAGFNTVTQINGFSSKSVCIPFPRKYDDQAWRARNCLNRGFDGLKDGLDEDYLD